MYRFLLVTGKDKLILDASNSFGYLMYILPKFQKTPAGVLDLATSVLYYYDNDGALITQPVSL